MKAPKQSKEDMPTFQVQIICDMPNVDTKPTDNTMDLPNLQKHLGRLQMKYGVPIELTNGRVAGVVILEYDMKDVVAGGTLLMKYWRILGKGETYNEKQTTSLVSTNTMPTPPEKEVPLPEAVQKLIILGAIVGKNKYGYYN